VVYISGKLRTIDEWKWSVEGMRQVGEYAKKTGMWYWQWNR